MLVLYSVPMICVNCDNHQNTHHARAQLGVAELELIHHRITTSGTAASGLLPDKAATSYVIHISAWLLIMRVGGE